MGRVRFYDADKDRYVTLRVESDGVYIDGHKLAQRKESQRMPPKTNAQNSTGETSAQYYARLSDPDVLEKILAVFNDIEQTFRLDPKSMVTIKPAYKKSGYDFGFKYREDWNTHSGQSVLETLVNYFLDTLAE